MSVKRERKDEAKKRKRMFSFYACEEEARQLDEAVERAHLNVSDFLRMKIFTEVFQKAEKGGLKNV